ncbi:MAG: transketolase [Acutalibacteraceae bacterium]|nr:transketolase [Clostridia bacterium]MEE1127864.1 transketolase [Acutalibacteraceae bacterium]MBQ2001152.1 transketolase [Clostridia bacterium]MBQ2319320.1 transketolase [Clostridia bacterium]MBQ2420956.1 transketolase [Clostridia bacterium]
MDTNKKQQLKITATKARMGIIEGTYNAKSGHPGGSLSITDVLTYLYFEKMNIDPNEPDKKDRDRFVLSKGHAAPALYSVLALRGFFSTDEIKKLRKPNEMLQGHPSISIPGVDMSTGSLGQGISTACGMALAAKLDGAKYRVYAALGDGEIEEGQVWEAAMFAAHKKLDNLTIVVDFNNLQIDGTLDEVNSPCPIDEKFAAFGWDVTVIDDGNDFDQIEKAFDHTSTVTGKPSVIIAKTAKGKGVSFMENQVGWHGKAPDAAQYADAMNELNAKLAELEG